MSNDSEKTIRPVDPDAEKTMRPQAGPEKTMRPSADAEKTMRPGGSNTERTMRPQTDAEKTMRPDQQKEKDSIVNRQFTEFDLNKIKYKVVKTISEGTGEAQIFLVENKERKFALKLYYVVITPPPNHDIMEIVRKSAGTGLLVDTFDHGVWTDPQSHEQRDYELMEYCSGGSLDQLKVDGDEKLLGEIAVRGAASLDFLHKQHILHRDVKPANFFFRKPGHQVDDMALADFGIAIPSDKSGKAVIDYQLRTKIYAAPEFYDMADGKIQISTKSDFYSLGMMLLTLLNGEEIFKLNEFELINMKKHGKLPYPQNIGERTLQLIKALTLPDPNARAGFDEVKRWAGGENIYNLKSEKDDVRKFNIVYNPTKNQTAESPEELAKFMLEDRELAGKYLYSGKINKWLSDNLRPDLAIDIETFVEKSYPKDQEAGLLASCYRLDENMPYFDMKGNALSSPQEIARSLKDNFKHYSKVLRNPNDSLFLFFNARGLANVTNEFAKLFKKTGDNRDALLQLVHTLDRSLPWIVVSYDGKTTTECRTPEDVIKIMYDGGGMDDQSWDDLLGEGFLTWLRYTDPAIEGKVRSAAGSKQRQSAVLYNLSPKVAYNYQMDETAGDYFFTAADMGNYMNVCMEEYVKDEKDDHASSQLAMMLNIDDTRLWDYLKSKGVYDDKITWIKYCTNLKSKENTKKAGPYSWEIAIYKAIKGLGYEPSYYFPKSGKRVSTLAELDSISEKEITAELKKDYLQAWLTTFYQENPALNLKKKYTFENETIKYIGHLERLDPQIDDVVNFQIGKKAVEKALANVKRKRLFHIVSKVLVGLFLLVGLGLTIFKLLTTNLPVDVSDHIGWISIVAGSVGVIAFLLMWIGSDQGCLINLIVGGVACGVIYAITYFLTPYVGYVIAALLLGLLIKVLISCYIKYPMYGKSNENLFKPTFEELELEPLQFVYSNDQNFQSSIGDVSYRYADYLSEGTKKLYKNLIMPVILMVGAGFLIWWAAGVPFKPKEEEKAVITATVTAGSLNMRSAANTSAGVVKAFRQGDTLTVTGEAVNGWVPVEYEGSTGYVSADYVEISGVPSSSSDNTTAEPSGQQTRETPTQPETVAETPIADFNKTFAVRPRARLGGEGVDLYVDRARSDNGNFYLFFTGAPQGDGGDGIYSPFWSNLGNVKLTNLDDPSQTWAPVDRGEDENLTKVTNGFYLVFKDVTGSRFSLHGADGYVFDQIDTK